MDNDSGDDGTEKKIGSIKNIHLYLNFVFLGFKIAIFFRFNL